MRVRGTCTLLTSAHGTILSSHSSFSPSLSLDFVLWLLLQLLLPPTPLLILSSKDDTLSSSGRESRIVPLRRRSMP